MKVSVEIECTPAEARAFFGLPDMTPLNDMMMERVKSSTSMMDAESVMKTWMNFGGAAQENFFKMMSGALPGVK